MNEVFLTLPIEKQQRIINAALEVFAKHDYKQASTDDIAQLAGISKGSLFYYFKNKQSLYMYIFEYVSELVTQSILDTSFQEVTDFFEMMDYGARRKVQLMKKNPYVLDFIMRCLKQREMNISDSVNDSLENKIQGGFEAYFKNIDFSKFKDNINPQEVYMILVYAMEGYIYNKQMQQEQMSVDSLMLEFEKWKRMFKNFCYKEEYIDE